MTQLPPSYIHTNQPPNPTAARAGLCAAAATVVVELQPAFGRLVDAVARDAVWLEETLQETAASDEFTRKLLEMRRDADAAGLLQTCSLGLLRSDYMLDAPGGDAADGSGKALQVELNTIASSFGCLSSVISGLHAYIAQKYEATPGVLPPNNAREGLCAGLAAAHMEFARQFPPTDLVPRRVAMVVQPGERNQMDQRMLEHGLWDGYGIDLRRVTLLDVSAALLRHGEDGAGLLPPPPEPPQARAAANLVPPPERVGPGPRSGVRKSKKLADAAREAQSDPSEVSRRMLRVLQTASLHE